MFSYCVVQLPNVVEESHKDLPREKSIKVSPSAVSVEQKVLSVCSAVQEAAGVDGVTDVMAPNQL